MTNRPCPACGSTLATEITWLDLVTIDDHPLQDGYAVASCDTCGTGFADVVPPTDWYAAFYRDAAKYATEVPDDWSLDRAKQAVDRVTTRVSFGKTTRVLDVGSGNGLVVQELMRRGFSAVGLDPSGANGAKMGSLDEVPEEFGGFDVILLLGVLEHVWQVSEAMSTVASLLAPDGAVYVEVPDAAAYASCYLAAFEDFNTEHVNHFSAASLNTLGRRFGFYSSTEHVSVPFSESKNAQYLAHVWRSPAIEFDSILRETLKTYTSWSTLDMFMVDEHLEAALEGLESFNLWGAGECAYRMLALPSLCKRECAMVVDGSEVRQRLTFNGQWIRRPVALHDNDLPIIVASNTRRQPILDEAERLGLTDRIVQ